MVVTEMQGLCVPMICQLPILFLLKICEVIEFSLADQRLGNLKPNSAQKCNFPSWYERVLWNMGHDKLESRICVE